MGTGMNNIPFPGSLSNTFLTWVGVFSCLASAMVARGRPEVAIITQENNGLRRLAPGTAHGFSGLFFLSAANGAGYPQMGRGIFRIYKFSVEYFKFPIYKYFGNFLP